MRAYGQYCPVAKAAEVLGDRWTLLIVRDLMGVRERHFNDLARGLPGISRSLLAQRLQQLEREGIVERHAGGKGRATEYQLTTAGQEIQQIIEAMLADWIPFYFCGGCDVELILTVSLPSGWWCSSIFRARGRAVIGS